MIEELVDSLLFEGYALYPYTPGAGKNATPTPFGIVYPAGYEYGFDHLQLQCLLRGDSPEVDVRGALPAGERRAPPGDRAACGRRPHRSATAAGRGRARRRAGGARPPARDAADREPTPFEGGSRSQALEHSLISTHPLLRVRGGHFVSPLEAPGCTNVNTWPVLAADDDSALLGAAIVLPDHPQLAPESRGSLFDGTEIEEALLLHVHALSDAERAEIEGGDPAVRAMVERALQSTPEDIMRLHGLLRPARAATGARRVRARSPRPRPGR